MAKIDRFNGNLKAFASEATGTNRTLFGEVTQADDLTSQVTADFKLGWQIAGPSDQPSLQDFNGAMYTHGQLLAYLHQAGVPEYQAAQEFFINSVTQYAGIIYISLTAGNIGNQPDVSPSNWREPYPQATETVRGSVEIGTQAEVDAGVLDNLAVTPKKLRMGFSYSFATNGYLVFPTWFFGFTIQWMTVNHTAGKSTSQSFSWPIQFPELILKASCFDSSTILNRPVVWSASSSDQSTIGLHWVFGELSSGTTSRTALLVGFGK